MRRVIINPGHFRINLVPLFQTSLRAKPIKLNEFDFHENEPVGGTHFDMNTDTKTPFDTEAKGYSKMPYFSIPGDFFRPGWLSTTRGDKRAKSQQK